MPPFAYPLRVNMLVQTPSRGAVLRLAVVVVRAAALEGRHGEVPRSARVQHRELGSAACCLRDVIVAVCLKKVGGCLPEVDAVGLERVSVADATANGGSSGLPTAESTRAAVVLNLKPTHPRHAADDPGSTAERARELSACDETRADAGG